jgi:single-stranded DNA-binding protein
MPKDQSINEVHIKGTCTREPYLGQGKKSPFAFVTVATGNGKYIAYHNISGFGAVADAMKDIKKGSTVEVEGRVSYRSKETKGVKFYEASIVADKVHHFLPEMPQDEGEEDTELPF